MDKDKIKIGTSGWSYADWKTVFYPEKIKQYEMLDYYAKHFPIVEINFTYYRMPERKHLTKMSQRVPDDFEFFVKANQDMTHYKITEVRRKDLPQIFQEFYNAIIGLGDKVKGILYQFPWSFKPTEENYKHLEFIAQFIQSTGQVSDIIFEFRNREWLTKRTSELMRKYNIVYCCVDEPRLKGLIPPIVRVTGPFAYIRFHGRNSKAWWKGDSKERYNYLYTKEELQEWIPKIEQLSKEADTVYIFFNNCHSGNAVKNAEMLQEMLL